MYVLLGSPAELDGRLESVTLPPGVHETSVFVDPAPPGLSQEAMEAVALESNVLCILSTVF